MRTIALPLLSTLLGLFQSRALLHLELLALRQQLAMVNQAPRKRLRFRLGQRLFWVWLYRLWPGCLQTLQVFKPDTLVRWHRKGFRLYCTWKSRCRRGGRPAIEPEVRELIRTMSRYNIGWGAPRIHGELQLLGIHVSQATVAKYMAHHPKPPSQTWRTFLDNHIKDLVSVDFFTVPAATFRILYVFIVLRHERRDLSTSMLPNIRLLSGRLSRWLKRFRGIQRPDISCVIAIRFLARSSVTVFTASTCKECSSPHVHLGRRS